MSFGCATSQAAQQLSKAVPYERLAQTATLGQTYSDRVALGGSRFVRYRYEATTALPRGLRLTRTGILTGTPAGQTGTHVFAVTASLSGHPGYTFKISVNVQPSPTEDISSSPMLDASSDTASVLPLSGSTGIYVSGRVDCSGYVNCNTSKSVFAGDSKGYPLTQFTQVYNNKSVDDTAITSVAGCTSAKAPSWIYNTATGNIVGVYIDDSVDLNNVWTYRTLIADCVVEQEYDTGGFATETAPFSGYKTHPWVILVGYRYDEAHNITVPQSYGGTSATVTGGMREWYPYCGENGKEETVSAATTKDLLVYKSATPPSRATISPQSGYIVQQKFHGWTMIGAQIADPASLAYMTTCAVSPLTSDTQPLWNEAWANVNGDVGQTSGSGSVTYFDLLANF